MESNEHELGGGGHDEEEADMCGAAMARVEQRRHAAISCAALHEVITRSDRLVFREKTQRTLL